MRQLSDHERWMVDLARRRCECDLGAGDGPGAPWLGSGARIVHRRATAVALAAGGLDSSTIADRTGLGVGRVQRLRDEFDRDGVAVILPDFEHSLTSELDDEDARSAFDAVAARHVVGGTRSAGTTVTLDGRVLRDVIVEDGLAADLSDAQVRRAFASATGRSVELGPSADSSRRPRRSDRWWFGGTATVLGVGSIACAWVAVRSPSEGAVALAGVLGLLALLMAAAFVHGRRVWHVHELMSVEPDEPAPVGQAAQASRGRARLPAVEFVDAMSPATDPSPPSPPAQVLFLWAFDRTDAVLEMIVHGWSALAPIALLVSPTALHPPQIKRLRAGDDHLIDDDETFEAQLARQPSPVESAYRLPAFTSGSALRYRGFPITAFACTDRYWKRAFEQLAARSDIAVLDAAGVDPARAGLSYEIRQLVDGSTAARSALVLAADAQPERVVDEIARSTTADSFSVYRTPPIQSADLRLALAPMDRQSRIARSVLRLSRTPDDEHEPRHEAVDTAARIWTHVRARSG